MGDVFKDKSSMPKEKGGYEDYYGAPVSTGSSSSSPPSCFPAGCSVGVDMTPEQRRNLNMSNYPRYDALDVEHVRRPRFGYGY